MRESNWQLRSDGTCYRRTAIQVLCTQKCSRCRAPQGWSFRPCCGPRLVFQQARFRCCDQYQSRSACALWRTRSDSNLPSWSLSKTETS